MPFFTLRKVGVSYMIEGLGPSGLDAERLWHDAQTRYGVAAAPMRAFPPPRERDLTAILIDRKVDSWEGLRRRLEDWVTDQGAFALSWDEQTEESVALLRFEL
jgi:hypothetical protein